jgi:hypothetical protein
MKHTDNEREGTGCRKKITKVTLVDQISKNKPFSAHLRKHLE